MVSPSSSRYKKIILKLSGQALAGSDGEVFSPAALGTVAERVKAAAETGIRIGLVCGGGNIIRGRICGEIEIGRITADQMGMLSTVINGLALRDALLAAGLAVRIFSSINVAPLAEFYEPRVAGRALDDGNIVIFSGGTGNPFVSTDTAAVLRACDMSADAVIKATRVDGIYSADPEKDPSARRYRQVSYDEALEKELEIMDLPAVALAREYEIPVVVFNFHRKNSLKRLLAGEEIGTVMR